MIALLLATSIAAVISLFGTRGLIAVLSERGTSQPILQQNAANARVPAHQHKAGTPTMGGVIVVAAALVGYLISHVRAGVVSYLMSLGIAAVLVVTTDIDTRMSLTRADLPGWDLGPVVGVLWAGTIIFATTKAVNVTDGLDGLAGGSALFGFIAFTGIAFWALRNPSIYGAVVNPYDLAVLAAAFAGVCAGFLWWNAAPARIFMGDVGALALGSALALLALTTNTQLVLILICGIDVIEAGSVGLQMAVFRASGRRRRLFLLSPIHHHFEVKGWPETTIIVRFWLISGACVAAAVAIFIADFTHQAALP